MVRIGDEYDVVIDALVKVSEHVKSWKVIPPMIQGFEWRLTTTKQKEYEIGNRVRVWVKRISSHRKHIGVSSSNHGRMPISHKMRPRYLRALDDCMSMLESAKKGQVRLADKANLSEFKGMFGRCFKKDQNDWCAVHQSFGLTDGETVRDIYRLIIQLQKHIKEDLFHQILEVLNELNSRNVDKMTHKARREIESSVSTKLDNKGLSVLQPSSEDKISISENEADKQSYTLSVISRQKLERANKVHSSTLDTLSSELKGRGYIPQYNKFIDLFCQREKDMIIFEIKSITSKNWLSQIRKGISQLYEYRYIHNLQGANLCLVLSQKPPENWVIDYMQDDRGIHICWKLKNSEEFNGIGWSHLFGEQKIPPPPQQ